MDVEADAVTEAVAEVFAVAGLGDDGGGDRVGLGAGHAGLDAFLGHGLGGEDGVVDALEPVVGLAEEEGAGEVGAVAVDDDAHVDDDAGALAKRDVARVGVGGGAPVAAGDDRAEGEVVGAVLHHVALDLPGELAFGHAGLDAGDGVRHALVAEADGAGEGVELAGVLDDAERLDGAGRGDEAGSGGLEEGVDGGGPLLVGGDGEVRGLEADRQAAGVLEDVGRDAGRGAGHLHQLELGGLEGDLLPVTGVGGEAGAVSADEDDAGGAGEAGDPAAVAGRGDEDGVELQLLEACADAVDAGRGHAWLVSAVTPAAPPRRGYTTGRARRGSCGSRSRRPGPRRRGRGRSGGASSRGGRARW